MGPEPPVPAHTSTKHYIALIIHKFHHNSGTPDPPGQILILLKMFYHDIEQNIVMISNIVIILNIVIISNIVIILGTISLILGCWT